MDCSTFKFYSFCICVKGHTGSADCEEFYRLILALEHMFVIRASLLCFKYLKQHSPADNVSPEHEC